jgi:hypothetical protein
MVLTEVKVQALFLVQLRPARVRRRNEDAEQAERQGKQNASDKKLQLAMAKAEKAPEAEEKRTTYLANRRGSHYLRPPSRTCQKRYSKFRL